MVQFRFTSDAVPQSLYADIQFLNSFSKAQIDELLMILIEFISGESGSDIMEDVASFSSKHQISGSSIKNTTRALLFFFKNALRVNLTPQFVKEDLQNFGLNEDKSALASQRWKEKFVVWKNVFFICTENE